MKKSFAILLMMAICIFSVAPAMAEAEEVYTYTLANWRYGPFPEERPIEEWAEDYFGIEIEQVYIDQNDYFAQLNTRLAGGDVPDAFLINDRLATAIDYYNQGLIGNFSVEFLRENCPGLCSVIDKYVPEAWTLGLVADGKLLSIPGFRLQYTISRPLHYNQTWLNNLGMELPVTLDEFEEVIYAFAKNDPDGNGVDDTYGISNTSLNAIYGAFGTQPTFWIENEEDGSISYGFTRPGMRDALELLARWYADGVIDPEYITGENMGGYWAITHAFCYQKIGVSGMGTYAHWYPDMDYNGVYLDPSGPYTNTGFIRDLGEDSFDVVMGPNPQGPDGYAGSDTSNPITWRFAFSADLVANEAKFAKLLSVIDEWYMNGEVNAILSNGKEGWWWTDGVDDSGNPARIYKEGVTSQMLDNPFDFVIDGNPDISYEGTPYEKYIITPNRAATNAYIEEVVIPTLNTEYMTRYNSLFLVALPSNDLFTDINTMISEGITKIITGEESIDYYDECLRLFEEMGGLQLTQEANEAYASLRQ